MRINWLNLFHLWENYVGEDCGAKIVYVAGECDERIVRILIDFEKYLTRERSSCFLFVYLSFYIFLYFYPEVYRFSCFKFSLDFFHALTNLQTLSDDSNKRQWALPSYIWLVQLSTIPSWNFYFFFFLSQSHFLSLSLSLLNYFAPYTSGLFSFLSHSRFYYTLALSSPFSKPSTSRFILPLHLALLLPLSREMPRRPFILAFVVQGDKN